MFNESSRKHLGVVTQIYTDIRLGLVWQRYSHTIYITLFTWINLQRLVHCVTQWGSFFTPAQGIPYGTLVLLSEDYSLVWLNRYPNFWLNGKQSEHSTLSLWPWFHTKHWWNKSRYVILHLPKIVQRCISMSMLQTNVTQHQSCYSFQCNLRCFLYAVSEETYIKSLWIWRKGVVLRSRVHISSDFEYEII